LEALHEGQYVHGNLQPSNVMVVESRVKMIGLSRLKSLEADEILWQSRVITQTPEYMAPEQFEKSAISAESDMYSLGISLFELLTGKLPIECKHSMQDESLEEYRLAHKNSTPRQDESLEEYRLAHQNLAPRQASECNGLVPGWLSQAIALMLEKEPSKRISIQGLRRMIEQNRPITVQAGMEQAKIWLDEMTHGEDESMEKALAQWLERLHHRLPGMAEQEQKDLMQFLCFVENKITEIKQIHIIEAVAQHAHFDPRLCPNLICGMRMESRFNECPQCKVSWKMPCVCERQELTSYMQDHCQRCRQQLPLPLEKKQSYALETTFKKCLEQEKYLELVGYGKAFEEFMQAHSSLQSMLEQAQTKLQEQAQQRTQAIAQALEQSQCIIQKDTLAQERIQEQRKKEQAQERQQHLAKMKKWLQSQEYAVALQYYETTLPNILKNEETQALYETICDALNEYEMQQAEVLMKQRKYDDAIAVLEKIEQTYRTKAWNDAVERIAEEKIQDQRKRHVDEIQRLVQAKEYTLALEYYEKTLPTGLKNEETQALYKKICHEFNEYEMQQAEVLMKQRKYDDAIAVLEKIEETYRTKAWNETVERIAKEKIWNQRKRRLKVQALAILSIFLIIVAGVYSILAYIEAARLEIKRIEKIKKERLKVIEAAMLEAISTVKREAKRIQAIEVLILEAARLEAARLEIKRIEKIKKERLKVIEAAMLEAIATVKREAERIQAIEVLILETKKFEAARLEAARLKAKPKFEESLVAIQKPGSEIRGFTYLKSAAYSCGGITKTVQEYKHNATGMEFVLIPGGTFTMGSPGGEAGRDSDEGPQHQVTLSPYLMSKTEVTQAVWERVMGSNPSYFKGPDRPVEEVSWNDCVSFCEKTGLALPTEAQWEFAARSGTQSAYYFGNDSSSLGNYAWYDGNSSGETHPVAQKQPNAYGLYDMAGNVWECEPQAISLNAA